MLIDGDILTLDVATNTGFCVGASDDPNPAFGHFTIPPTGDDVGRFGIFFEDWLTALIDFRQIGIVVFEAPILPRQTQLMTVRKLSGLALLVEMICRRRKIKCREARASSVKKFFAGTGKAKKVDTMEVCRRYGWRVKTDDEADACALWAYSVALYAPQHAGRFALGPIGARELF
jgi:Holliday junction resolvasome RuvABC endonuclease subunit